jgi:hypothetical protein
MHSVNKIQQIKMAINIKELSVALPLIAKSSCTADPFQKEKQACLHNRE